MGKGLKQLAAEAAATPIEEQIHLPIHVSPEARYVLGQKVRAWTGWRDATLVFGKPDPRVSPYAMCEHEQKRITVDPEPLILNPNRVLLTVTPFRLRQEAVLTGILLHEASHARHTHWKPRTIEELTTKPLLHSDGEVPTPQATALATLMEEPRVEGLMFAEADNIGAVGLGWTMRAMAAHLMPMTEVAADPSQALMDLLTSWTLRAGRQIALAERSRGSLNKSGEIYTAPGWVMRFTSLLHQNIEAHLEDRVEAGAVLEDGANEETPNYRALRIVGRLRSMLVCDDDTGPTMIDTAREVLELLFPETDDDDDSDANDGEAMPMIMCGSGAGAQPDPEEGTEGEGDEAGSDGEGNTEPEDEGSGDDPGVGDSGSDDAESEDESAEQDSDGGEDPDEGDSPADGGSDPEDGQQEGGASPSTPSESQPSAAQQAMAKALAELEAEAKEQVDDEAEAEAEAQPPMPGGTSGGSGAGGAHGGGWRTPDVAEREIAKGAEKFLRDMIDASESSQRSLTDQPSAIVDGAKLAEWKAGGQVREPHFFVRNRRNVEPSPPIRIAILADISSSMDILQKPTALLSWALANAALDLRNFAGRGQRVESCLIHWGDSVRVMQKPGEVLPGIREASCDQGTSAMWRALDEVEVLMPGFFDLPDRPVNRLLVQFTDWKLFGYRQELPRISRALEAGVNMLSVVPSNYSARYAHLTDIIKRCPVQRGRHSLIKYNPSNPGLVWTQAAEMLSGNVPDEAAQFGF